MHPGRPCRGKKVLHIHPHDDRPFGVAASVGHDRLAELKPGGGGVGLQPAEQAVKNLALQRLEAIVRGRQPALTARAFRHGELAVARREHLKLVERPVEASSQLRDAEPRAVPQPVPNPFQRIPQSHGTTSAF